MQLVPQTPDVHVIERFQSLQAGQYWQATSAIPAEAITKGMVLLIQSLKWVDDKVHTVVLRAHPSIHGKYLQVETSQGYLRSTQVLDHMFLFADFMANFEYAPDAQAIRAGEIQKAQGAILQLQQELMSTQADPQKMAAIVASETTAPTSEVLQLDEVNTEKATGAVAAALTPALTEKNIASMRETASRAHEVATIQANWIKDKTDKIAEAINGLTPYFTEQAAAALAATEDTRRYVDSLLKGIESLDLYVGKDVEVIEYKKGVSAPADVPLTIVQAKRLMDEELSIWTSVDENFDISRKSALRAALQEHQGLVDQIFPTARCVLVMAVTARYINYGDAWTNHARNEANKVVFLLIRDGENIYEVQSPVESHLAAANLFPSEEFKGIDGTSLKFNDVAYSTNLERHELEALHYKRFLLLLCGLDHRLNLLGSFYPGPKDLSFVSMEFQANYMRFLVEDPAILLGSSELPPLDEWLDDMNKHTTKGSRVVACWREVFTPEAAPTAVNQTYSSYSLKRIPVNNYGTVVLSRETGSLIARLPVTNIGGEVQKAPCRVNFSVAQEQNPYAYLCLDAVDPLMVEKYLNSRLHRRKHLAYVALFKAALRVLREDAQQEASQKAELINDLIAGNVGTPNSRKKAVNAVIQAWRVAHHGAAFPSLEDFTPEERVGLQNSLFSLAAVPDDTSETIPLFSKLQVECVVSNPLVLSVTSKGKFLLYAAPLESEQDNRFVPHGWVHCLSVKKLANGALKETARKWVQLPKSLAGETVLMEWPEYTKWVRTALFRSPAEKDKIITEIASFEHRFAALAKPKSDSEFKALCDKWFKYVKQSSYGKKFVQEWSVAIPVGLTNTDSEVAVMCLSVTGLEWLATLASSTEHLEILNKHLDALYQSPKSKINRALNAFTSKILNVKISKAPLSYVTATPSDSTFPFKAESTLATIGYCELSARDIACTNWDAQLEAMGPNYWKATETPLSMILGYQVPECYCPTRVTEVTGFNEGHHGVISLVEVVDNTTESQWGASDFEGLNVVSVRQNGRIYDTIPEAMAKARSLIENDSFVQTTKFSEKASTKNSIVFMKYHN